VEYEKLDEFFLPMDVEYIRNIPLCHRVQSDFWAWNFKRNGIFTVRSCYRILATTKRVHEDWLEERPASSNDEEKAWAKLWKTAVPAKIQIFLWRLARQSLPTRYVRNHRDMAPSPACSICGQEDSWRHSLIECNLARCLWAMTNPEITEHIYLYVNGTISSPVVILDV
jgi:hypothetical protein